MPARKAVSSVVQYGDGESDLVQADTVQPVSNLTALRRDGVSEENPTRSSLA